ncbi:trypsin-like peptidase [Pseudonocardia hierapolitana]|uniref:Trypsin-like peptidase n=1 Tax=Pseudonocardia hierapolitana TaxID=1128676 RepID=A0A561SQD7_9PSEU|nr:trypsin-like peptidase domain-containing protein [Pseudonocardia hierapolitana]TWF77075.1 trypsin-like peptidase [Pseudonocardia hierapolitana]
MTTTQRDQAVPARVIVRVLDPAGEPVGAGFVIGEDLVATCAHVAAAAVRADPYDAQPPSQRIALDLPLLIESDADVPARVSAEVARWIPIAPEGTGDIAVLRVRDPLPEGARMPPLRRVDQLWDHTFRVLGFPAGMADGVWATGRFRGRQGTRWFQMQATAGEQPIVPGFSGSPVWDEESGAVVGMTVATDVAGTSTAYLIPIDLVLGVDPELLPCPYRGLEPFGEEHASFFFGRDADIGRLVDAVERQPLVAVAGPSGAGKSSLVRAGLLPRLRADGVQVAELRPMPGRPVAELVADVAALVPAGQDGRVVLVLDQFEELAATDPDAATELLERIGELVGGGRARAVLTLRSATLDDIRVPELANLLGSGTVLLPPMDRRQLRAAIVAPAERAPGLSFEPGLVDRILDDAAAEPGQLPLVESLLTELWARRDGGYLTLRAYEEAGGVAGVVATHAESVVAGFDPADGDRLRRLFTALAGPDRDGRFVRRPLRWGDVPADLRPLVLRLAAGRLVVVERAADGQETIQLAHQALIAHWPRLRDWLTEDRDFIAWRDQVGQQRERWEESGHDDGALLRGAALATALDRLPARTADVPAPDVEFVQRSRARQRREVRRWRIVTAVLGVITLAAGALAVVAVDRGNALGEQLDRANAELLAQTSLSRAPTDPVTSTQLALAAWRLDPGNAAARTALLRQYVAMRSVDGVIPAVTTESIIGFGLSADGRVMVVPENEGLVVLTGLPDGPVQRHTLPGAPPGLLRASVDPTGRYVATMDRTGVVRMWDVAGGGGPRFESAPPPGTPDSRVFGFAGDRLLWLEPVRGGADLRIWDVAAAAPVAHGLGTIMEPDVVGIVLTPDFTRAVIRLGDIEQPDVMRLTVRSLADGATLGTLPEHSALLAGAASAVLCQSPATGAGSAANRATAVVTGPDLATPQRRIPVDSYTCAGFRRTVTLDGRHRAERLGGPLDVDFVRIRDLSDGSAYDVTLPPDPIATTFGGGRVPAEKMLVLPGPDGTRTVLAPHGTSLLRLTALPNPYVAAGEQPWLGMSDDGRTIVATEGHRDYTTFDRAGGGPIGRLDVAALGGEPTLAPTVDHRLALRTRAEDGWSIAEYALPSLERVLRVELPSRTSGPASRADTDTLPDRIYSLADGLLTGWDRATGAPLGPPVDLATTPQRRQWFIDTSSVLEARPGHPGEVAVLGPDNTIELWDVGRGIQLTTLPQVAGRQSYAFAFDDSGSRLASATSHGVLDVWDLDRRELVAPSVPTEGTQDPVGFTADGMVVTSSPGGESGVLTFWDPASGRASGSVRLTLGEDNEAEVVDGTRLEVAGGDGYTAKSSGALPIAMALTAQQWADELCHVSRHQFTDVERAALPSGSTIDPPC